MKRLLHTLAALRRDQRGAMLVETAIVAPVLLIMSMGSFQISQVIARQTELQGAAAQATSIALAAAPATSSERATVKSIIVEQTGLTSNEVSVTETFRCGSATTYVNSESSCVGTKVSSYLLIQLNDTYTPVWTEWGFGSPIQFNVDRYVMIKQS